jgi:hypothetical protein
MNLYSFHGISGNGVHQLMYIVAPTYGVALRTWDELGPKDANDSPCELYETTCLTHADTVIIARDTAKADIPRHKLINDFDPAKYFGSNPEAEK